MHATLQYQWMDWLPDQSVIGIFWTALLPKIEKRVRDIPFLRSHNNHLNFLDELRHVPERYKDQHGEPLFEDLTEERYLGYGYEKHLDCCEEQFQCPGGRHGECPGERRNS
jgi:hypothetical protein